MSAVPKLLPFRVAGAPEVTSIPSVAAGRDAAQGATSPRAALIDPADQAQAEGRLETLQPLLDYDAGLSAAGSRESVISAICESSDVHRATLLRWLARWREGGLPALADRRRCDKGTSRWFEQNKKAAWAAAYLWLECRQSARAVYEAIVEDRELLELRNLPTYETVRAFLASAPTYLKTYAREGRREYQQRMSPFLTRGYVDVAPNQIWVSDHAIHDVEVANDCFPEIAYGAPMRLRFTCLFDYRSRFVVGTSWCVEGSSGSIATALRGAISRFGPCAHFYADNGKDYRRVARGAAPAYLRDAEAIRGWREQLQRIERVGVLARLGVKITHCIVRHPQSKHVERFFRTMHERFDRRWHQHYTAGAPHLRPDSTSAAMSLHRQLLRRGRAADSTHPPASLFIALCMEWIEEYHNHPHEGRGMEGATPAEIFATRSVPQAPVDLDALALLLEEHMRLKVRECAVEWTPVPKGGKRRYSFFDATSRDMLHALNETEVVVAYDPNDLDAVALLDDSGHFLTWAKVAPHLRMDPADRETQDAIAQSMADRRHLEKTTRLTLEGISRGARAIGARTPVERMAARPQLVPVIESALTHRSPKPKPSPDDQAPMTAEEIAADFWRSE